jgi:hypothetical protein
MIILSSLLFNCWEFSTRHPGILLVLLGVAGEVVFDWKEMKGKLAWAKKLSALVLIAGLILEFSEAAKSDKDVSAAIERAGNAEKEAGQANERAGKFDADRIMVEKEAEEIRSTNLVLQAKLLELEGNMKPRTITSEQQTNLIACLSRAPEKGKIDVFASVLDVEAVGFAIQISNVLAQAGFEVHCPTGLTPDAMVSIGPPGTCIAVKDVKKPSPQGAYIQRCFMSVGIEMPAMNSGDANISSNSVEISVGQHF